LAVQFVRASDGPGAGRLFGGSNFPVLQWRAQHVFRTHGLCVQETRDCRVAQVVRQPDPHATDPRQPPGRPYPAVGVDRHASAVRNQNKKRNRPRIQRRRQAYGMTFIMNMRLKWLKFCHSSCGCKIVLPYIFYVYFI